MVSHLSNKLIQLKEQSCDHHSWCQNKGITRPEENKRRQQHILLVVAELSELVKPGEKTHLGR